MLIEVKINKKILKFVIDTGIYVTVITEATKNAFFPELSLEATTTVLKDYIDTPLKPVRMLKGLQVQLNGRTETLSCFVMPGSKRPLIGRQWLAALGEWPLRRQRRDQPATSKSCYNMKAIDWHGKFAREFKDLFGPTRGRYNKG